MTEDGRRRPIISIMGDRFMLPSMFERAIRRKCGEDAEIRSYEAPWPDEPMEHGYATPGMEGLKEYQGTADEVVAHMDGNLCRCMTYSRIQKAILRAASEMRTASNAGTERRAT